MKYWSEAINNYANFSGRSRRRDFWYFILWQLIFGLTILALADLAATLDGDVVAANVLRAFADFFALITIVPTLAIGFRRMHDIGRPGWMALLGLVPVAGFVLLAFCCQDGDVGFNQYGPNPKNDDPALMASL